MDALDGAEPDPVTAPWDPLGPGEVARILAAWDRPWWIAGGHAIEFAVGKPVRTHDDVDVLILRRDQNAVQRALAGWDLWAADPPGHLRPRLPSQTLPATVHDAWCRPGGNARWQLQLTLDESVGDLWGSRRDPRIRRPVAGLGRWSAHGIPSLAPEVQLFYKARAPRPKDDLDLAAALPLLRPWRREWLSQAVRRVYGDARPWAGRLQ